MGTTTPGSSARAVLGFRKESKLSRLTRVVVTMMVVGLVAGCVEQDTTPLTSLPSTSLPSTTWAGPHITFVDLTEWSPRNQPGPELLAEIEGSLERKGVFMLLPLGADTVPSDASVRLRFETTVPGHVNRVQIIGEFAGITGTGGGFEVGTVNEPNSDCPDLIAGRRGGSGYVATTVRGFEGCESVTSSGGANLHWTEGDQRFYASIAGLTLEEAKEWLATWVVVPPAPAG